MINDCVCTPVKIADAHGRNRKGSSRMSENTHVTTTEITPEDLNKPDRYVYVAEANGAEVPKMMRLLGHNLLVRVCHRSDSEFLVGDAPPESELSREAEMMLAAFREDTTGNWAEVIAIGPECDTPRSRDELNSHWKNRRSVRERTGKRWMIPRCFNHELRVGDMVCVQELPDTNRQWRTIGLPAGFVITDEANVLSKFEKVESDTP